MRIRGGWTSLRIAAAMAIVEHARNRFALLLILVLVPFWITTVHLVVTHDVVRFPLHSTGRVIAAAGNDISVISGGMNVVALIVGFMMFTVTFRGGAFDQRLVLAGYPRVHLVLGKAAALAVAATLICAYAVAVISVLWHPHRPVLLAVSLLSAALPYGAIGVLLGALVREELQGMFLIILLTSLDSSLQNPVANPSTGNPVLHYLPSYGAMQTAVGAGFLDDAPVRYLLLQPLWFAGALVLAALAFKVRTRDRRPRSV